MGNMRERKTNKIVFVLAGIAGVLVLAGVVSAIYYSGHLMRGTTINGIAVSGKTPGQVKDAMEQYELTVYQKSSDGSEVKEVITGEQLGLEMSNQDAIKKIIKKQGIIACFVQAQKDYVVEDLLTLDENKLQTAVQNLKAAKAAAGQTQDFTVQDAKDAYISDYVPGKGYEIVKETEGNRLDPDVALEKIKETVLKLDPEINLAEAGCYEQPSVTSEDKTLNQMLEQLNTYTSAVITYQFGDNEEVLNGDTIHEWLKVKKNKVVLQKKKVEEYVSNLRRKYDTIFTNRTFQTSYGKKVHISGGDYGWWMNTSKETEKLQKLITKGKQVTRTPEYFQQAASYGENDYGDSYVEINLTAQHLFVYEKGKKVYESDFVSGNVSAGNGTPEGVYALTYKEEMAELVGENYSTPVSYWMPFNGNIGMHDATWRSQFGASLYKTGGSHGCVNLPYAAAKIIFEYVEKGSPVICYQLAGTESSHTTSQSDQQIAQAVIESIDKIGKVTSASRKRIDHSRAIYNELGYSQRSLVTNYNKLLEAEAKLRG